MILLGDFRSSSGSFRVPLFLSPPSISIPCSSLSAISQDATLQAQTERRWRIPCFYPETEKERISKIIFFLGVSRKAEIHGRATSSHAIKDRDMEERESNFPFSSLLLLLSRPLLPLSGHSFDSIHGNGKRKNGSFIFSSSTITGWPHVCPPRHHCGFSACLF